MKTVNTTAVFLIGIAVTLLVAAPLAIAHCDTPSGPVIPTAKVALDSGDLTPVLKWIQPQDEKELHSAFDSARKVRTESKSAKELADRYFIETLLRLHRAGEGVSFTGIKEDSNIDSLIVAGDRALENGVIDTVIQQAQQRVAQEIRERFDAAKKAKQSANQSVVAGREFVARYVKFIHYLEQLTTVEHAVESHSPQSESHTAATLHP
jgi:hypothetical protein